jgi:hypothetical protein
MCFDVVKPRSLILAQFSEGDGPLGWALRACVGAVGVRSIGASTVERVKQTSRTGSERGSLRVFQIAPKEPQRATESCSIMITQAPRRIWSELLTQALASSIINGLSHWGLKDSFGGSNPQRNGPEPVMITGQSLRNARRFAEHSLLLGVQRVAPIRARLHQPSLKKI